VMRVSHGTAGRAEGRMRSGAAQESAGNATASLSRIARAGGAIGRFGSRTPPSTATPAATAASSRPP
jgi:hypothetical protein